MGEIGSVSDLGFVFNGLRIVCQMAHDYPWLRNTLIQIQGEEPSKIVF